MTKIFENTAGHGSLLYNLMDHWEKPFDGLPEELKPQVKRALPLWDEGDASSRPLMALRHDLQNDQDLEEAVCWELDRFLEEAGASEKKARAKVELNSKDQASEREFRIWGDVQKRLNSILDDRARVGSEIQGLKRNAGEYEKLENEVIQLRAENAELKKNNNPALTSHPCKDKDRGDYAPELAMALELWEELYLNANKSEYQSHTEAADHWLNNQDIDPELDGDNFRIRLRVVTNLAANKKSQQEK